MVENNNFTPSSKNRLIAILLLIITTILWGSTFIISKNIIQNVPIFFYLGMRFLFALLIFTPYLVNVKKFNKRVIGFGLLTGVIYWISIVIQTFGLLTTTAGKGGFLTGLNTVMVPFLAWLFYKKAPNNRIWVAVGLSVFGMALLLLEGEGRLVIGDILVLCCAFGFALYIILVDKHVELVDIYLYLIVQLMVITLLCFGFSLLFIESYNPFTAGMDFWIVMIYMGCIASGLTFLFQNWGQKQLGPAQTAIIFTLEPVFALLFASFLIGDEIITVQGLIGCSLIFAAILITVIKNRNEENSAHQD